MADILQKKIIFKHSLFNENIWISSKISLKFVPKGPVDKSVLCQVKAWHLLGDKTLPEPTLTQIYSIVSLGISEWDAAGWFL